MRRAFSLIDIKFDNEDSSKLKYYLVHKNTVVGQIKISGKKIVTKSSATIKIVQDTIYSKWYQQMLAPFVSLPEENSKFIYNCIDIGKRKSIGQITFDKGYKTFSSTVCAPYSWISSELFQGSLRPAGASRQFDMSEMLPSPSPSNAGACVRQSFDLGELLQICNTETTM